jgi:serine/threonine protein kinase
MKKQRGGRLKNIETFRATCDSADKKVSTGWLVAKRSIKTPDEAQYDEFVHLLLSVMNSTDVVVKLQTANSVYSRKENKILHYLSTRKQNNMIGIICQFECNDNLLRWNTEIRSPSQFCAGGNDMFMLTVMEYVPISLPEILKYDTNIVRNVIQQISFAIIEMNITNAVSHGDLNSGNILIDKGEPSIKKYNIGGNIIDFQTMGYEPVFIDFQMGTIGDIKARKVNFTNTQDDLGIVFHMLGNNMTAYKSYLHGISLQFQECTNLIQIIKIIQNITFM